MVRVAPFEEAVPNPFINRSRFGLLEKIKFFLFLLVVFPLRLFLFLLAFTLAWLFALLSVGTGLRAMTLPMAWCLRIVLFAMGYFWVSVRNRPSRLKARFIICNHHGFVEALYIIIMFRPIVISAQATCAYPVISAILKSLKVIPVDRVNSESRKLTGERMMASAKDHSQPPILIFPEGTCTNGEALIRFKPGVFLCGEPIQPVVVKMRNRNSDISWVAKSRSYPFVIIHHFCQVFNRLEFTFLDVVHPPPASAKPTDAHFQICEQTRAMMAEALGIPRTDHSYSDVRLSMQALEMQLPADSVVVEIEKMGDQFSIDFNKAAKLVETFAAADLDKSGDISYKEFISALGVPDSDVTQQAFHLLDLDENGMIDFREFLLAVCQDVSPNIHPHFLKEIFSTVSEDGATCSRTSLAAFVTSKLPALSTDTVSSWFDKEELSEIEFESRMRDAPLYCGLLHAAVTRSIVN